MKSRDELSFRLGLAEGFLGEAIQDLGLERWRSCVDNSQLAAENAGKCVLALFGVPPKTHEPARELAALLKAIDLPAEFEEMIRDMLPGLIALGLSEHFMTDYGDEANYRLPWEIFTRDSAVRALEKARGAVAAAKRIVDRSEELAQKSKPEGQS